MKDNVSRRDRHQKKKRSGRSWIRTLLGVILILFAVGLLALDPIKNHMIRQGTETNQVANFTREQIEQNETADVTFNWDDISTLDAQSVFANQENPGNLPVIGGIAIPELNMNLPIHKGVSEAGMFFGAGTLYEDMEMGFENYSIASHHSIHDELLFAPLMDAAIGQTIYLTDLETIYEYEIDFVETVPETRIDLTYPTETPKVTLITCDPGLIDRVVVQGELISEVSINDASQEMLAAFNIPETVPE